MSRRIGAVLSGLLLTFALVACGGDASSTGGKSQGATLEAATFPVTIDGTTIDARPKAIVSLSPSATETLFAIGAGEQVIAVDLNSNYPPAAPKGDLDAYKPNVEAIAGKNPDLVVVSDDLNDVVAGLTALRIPVLVEQAPADMEGVYEEIEELGRATGHRDRAAALVKTMKTEISNIVADADVAGLSYYYELDNTYYSQTSKTFLGTLIGQLGLVNIADGAGGASDYPQLSAEHIIKTDPDLILLADTKCCNESAATVKARAGWADLKAVKNGGVVELDDDVASRWGPRIGTLLSTIANAARKVKTRS